MNTTEEPRKYTSGDLHVAVKNSFPSPNYLYMQEVRDATGFDAVRSADGIAVGMYRSCGRQIHGFEMKVSRTDWLKELSQPAKAESLMRYCHRWALIVPDASIVHDGELPSTWGLGVPDQTRKNALVRVKWLVKPPELVPVPFSMVFLTALMYAAKQVDEPKRLAELRAEFDRGKAAAEREVRFSDSAEKLKKLQAAVDAFAKTSGIRITEYTGESTAEKLGVEFAEYKRAKGDISELQKRLEWMRDNSRGITKAIENGIELITKGPEPPLTYSDLIPEEVTE